MSEMPQPKAPNITDFTAFVRNVMQIKSAYLPDSSPLLTYALNYSLNTVNLDIDQLPSVVGSWSLYQLAVFNLAGAVLIEFAPDQSYDLAAAAWSAGISTVTTAENHSIRPGDKLTIDGISPNGFNSNSVKLGYFVALSVPDQLHFTYAVAPNPGTPVLASDATVSEQFFMNARKGFRLASFVPGAIASASDLSTSAGFVSPEFLKGLTIENLQLLKTPWGRAYLQIAQKYGPTIWGIS